MSKFGEDLRKERMSRGIALEHISAVTKISQRHLVALEQESFRLLPGGILSKGIVRGYVSALGLDPGDWTVRFLQACNATGQTIDDESGWTAFASNVGKARIQRHNEQEIRMRWIGAIVFGVVACVGGYFSVRYYGVRAGWWSSMLPVGGAAVHSAVTSTHSVVTRVLTWVGF
jgi:cytoskeleton protein RodZ